MCVCVYVCAERFVSTVVRCKVTPSVLLKEKNDLQNRSVRDSTLWIRFCVKSDIYLNYSNTNMFSLKLSTRQTHCKAVEY